MARDQKVSVPIAIAFIFLLGICVSFVVFSKKSVLTILNEKYLKERIKKEEAYRPTARFDPNGSMMASTSRASNRAQNRSGFKSGRRENRETATGKEAEEIFERDFAMMRKLLIELSFEQKIKLNSLSQGVINAICDMIFYIGKRNLGAWEKFWDQLRHQRVLDAVRLLLAEPVATREGYLDRTTYNAYLMITNIDDNVASTDLTSTQRERVAKFVETELQREQAHSLRVNILHKMRYSSEKDCPKDTYFDTDLKKCLDRFYCGQSYEKSKRHFVENHRCHICDEETIYNGQDCVHCPIDTFTTIEDNICHPKTECDLVQDVHVDRIFIADNECDHCSENEIYEGFSCTMCPQGTVSPLNTNKCVSPQTANSGSVSRLPVDPKFLGESMWPPLSNSPRDLKSAPSKPEVVITKPTIPLVKSNSFQEVKGTPQSLMHPDEVLQLSDLKKSKTPTNKDQTRSVPLIRKSSETETFHTAKSHSEKLYSPENTPEESPTKSPVLIKVESQTDSFITGKSDLQSPGDKHLDQQHTPITTKEQIKERI